MIGSILRYFLEGIISIKPHCQASKTLSFLRSSLCSREQTMSHLYSLLAFYGFLVVHLPILLRPTVDIPFLWPNLLFLKNKFSDTRSHCSLCMSFIRIAASRTKLLTIVCPSEKQSQAIVQSLECREMAEETFLLNILNKVV